MAISSHFINAPYAANTLIGGPQEAEQLVLDLTAFDCFTFLDVVEALRRSSNADDFPAQLQQVRYRDGKVDYAKRRHFFSDWVAGVDTLVSDVTEDIGQGSAQSVVKQLNCKEDGTVWLPGIAVAPRDIMYIPASRVDAKLLSALQPGDYVGLYSEQAGLDVNHTGLIIVNRGKILLRHASSRSGVKRVVDEDLFAYLQGKPGLVVYRAKP
ncbi:MAG: N-acetylmuramoyl-L-alanine amidase-like domain-containing protein [Desulfuromonadales bacterium]